MLSKFEQYLISQRYTRFVYSKKGWIKDETPDEKFYYASPSNVVSLYIRKDAIFAYGLHEAGLPPCLISPRPKIDFFLNGTHYTESFDIAISAMFEHESVETIYKECLTPTKTFTYDG